MRSLCQQLLPDKRARSSDGPEALALALKRPSLSPWPDYPCSGMLGMVSGQISDAQISVSSNADRGWVAENARLLTGRTGWTGQQVKQPFRNEWIQVGCRWEAGRSADGGE